MSDTVGQRLELAMQTLVLVSVALSNDKQPFTEENMRAAAADAVAAAHLELYWISLALSKGAKAQKAPTDDERRDAEE